MTQKYNLNWDKNSNNGIITNSEYPSGAMFNGLERKPVIPSIPNDYQQFIYQETSGIFVIALAGDETFRTMTSEEKSAIRSVAKSWVQLEGEEGNPNADQLAAFKLNEMKASFKAETASLMGLLDEYEPITWAVQEKEARAYLADNTAATPSIDALLSGRSIQGETRSDLVSKIIANADSYVLFYNKLGKLQGLSKLIEAARFNQDKAAIAAITWT